MFKFDNSYSWTRSKEIFYSIKLFPPNVTPPPLGDHTQNSRSSPLGGGDEAEEFFECNDRVNSEGNEIQVVPSN